MNRIVKVGKVRMGGRLPFVLIAGPCVIESRELTLKIARDIKKICARLKIPFIFKASYDKANRTSIKSFRGPGISQGLQILKEVRKKIGVPVLSDVHSSLDVVPAAHVLDVIQIPAFLCRQTDLVIGASLTGRAINVKKGQFLAPWDMSQVVEKIESTGNRNIILTERGVSFGYNNLINDFRSLKEMRKSGYPVVFDATHSVQKPGGLKNASGGDSKDIPLLSRCAVAAGCHAVFMEVHPQPSKAKSDGPNMLPLNQLEKLLTELKKIDSVVKKIKDF